MTLSAKAGPHEERDELFSYYEAQADNYEDFYDGKGQAIGALEREYRVDTAAISTLLTQFGRGEVVDLACGTAFWLSAYGANCARVTLVDQSGAALARCRRRVDQLGLHAVARVVQGDLFEVPLEPASYDAGMLGFLLSHLADAQLDALFDKLRVILRAQSELAVVDSGWSDARRPYCQREGFESRVLADGRVFRIRKNYFDREALEAVLGRHGFRVRSAYVGKVFIATVASRVV